MPYLNIKAWLSPCFAGLFLISTLSSCGMLTNKSEKDYLKSKTIDVISVPDGLHQPVNRDPMNIPYVADDYKPPEDIIVPPPLTIEEVKLAIVESSTDKSSDKETQGEKVALKPLTAEVVTDADFEFSLLV